MKATNFMKNTAKNCEILTIDESSVNDAEITLSERSEEIDVKVEADLLKEIVSNLKRTIKANNLKSLSAPAIGYKKRIFCINFDTEIKTFINPVIATATGLEMSRETCTSIPNRTFIRPRNNDIMVVYQRPTGQIENRQMVGLAAIIYQHEIDHLDGLLLSDVGLEIDEQFDNATEEERMEVINAYIDALDIKQKEINTEITNDPELKQIVDAEKFMTSVYKGETKLE